MISENRRVKYDYHIIKSYEAGIVLKGTEVKSIRARRSSIKEAYCYEYHGEIFIKNYHIAHYPNAEPHDVLRIKKLLLKKREIRQIRGLLSQNRYTMVPKSIYTRGKNIKLEVVLVVGKNKRDKRATIREREYRRSLQNDLYE